MTIIRHLKVWGPIVVDLHPGYVSLLPLPTHRNVGIEVGKDTCIITAREHKVYGDKVSARGVKECSLNIYELNHDLQSVHLYGARVRLHAKMNENVSISLQNKGVFNYLGGEAQVNNCILIVDDSSCYFNNQILVNTLHGLINSGNIYGLGSVEDNKLERIVQEFTVIPDDA